MISSPRHTADDLRVWARLEAVDRMRWRRDERRLRRALDEAARDAAAFVAEGPCYAGLSTGKDSVLLCHVLAMHGIAAPVVYVEVVPHASPEAPLVVARVEEMGLAVDRIVVVAERDERGQWAGTGRLEAGFAEAARRYGDRYLSGVRADESYARTMRLRGHGVSTLRTCAPLARLSTSDVFACAAGLSLPLHPAYAMTAGGLYDRAHLRVATLGGSRGTERGRREWEMRYYRAEMESLGLATRAV